MDTVEWTKVSVLIFNRLEKSDQDHKSVTVRRNINILRSAVLSNRRLLEKLNAAESKVNDSRETETEPRDNEGSSSAEENMAGAAFRKELEIANKSQETSVILSYPHETDRNVQLFKAYEALRNDPPASNTLTSSLPISVVSVRTGASRPSGLLTDASKSESISLDKENPTKEIRLLLTEWTDTSPNLVRIYLGDAATDDAAESLPKKPSQEQQRSEHVVYVTDHANRVLQE